MLSFLYVYSDHSILECYNLFSGVELSMRSFFVITFHARNFCIAYNLISTMNHYSKSEEKNTGVVNIINSNTTKCLVT